MTRKRGQRAEILFMGRIATVDEEWRRDQARSPVPKPWFRETPPQLDYGPKLLILSPPADAGERSATSEPP